MSTSQKKRVTITDVALKSGVSRTTVSYVLNASQTQISISQETRDKVLRAARECGYRPNAAARALSRQRTGHLGFILSDNVREGFGSSFFSACLDGVERACRARDYGLNVSLYNLSNIDTFIFPPSVGERSVDGVVLTGFVEAAVIRRFRECGVPCVCIGDDTEVAELVATVAPDVAGGLLSATRHLVKLGHRRIACHVEPTRRGLEVIEQLNERIAGDLMAHRCRVEQIEFDIPTDHTAGRPLLEAWMRRGRPERPTAIISNEHVLLSLLRKMEGEWLSCPRDISLVSSGDSALCELAFPQLTALHEDFLAVGRLAVDLLIDAIENSKPLTPDMSHNDCLYNLVVRDSTGPARNES